MPTDIVVGCQWGDEGKGKIVDMLLSSGEYRWNVRYQGGPNAGHTVYVGDNRYVFHSLPSGLLCPDVHNVIGNGVCNVVELSHEIETNRNSGLEITPNNFSISPLVHAILPHHIDQEKSANSIKIGTTGRGIGPAYKDKAARLGIRIGDLYYIDRPGVRREVLDRLEKSGYPDPVKALEELEHAFGLLKPFVADTPQLLNDALRIGDYILCEGAQGTFLDIDHGTYPFVTSSNTTAGGALAGLGIGTHVHRVIGVVKAYTTRVGEGPFPTELKDETGEYLRKQGKEFGATTGRPRRCGWFDGVLVRRASDINGLTSIALTKLDVLTGLKKVQVCTSYRIDSKRTDTMPMHASLLADCEPVYDTLDGWNEKMDRAETIGHLPKAARDYVEKLDSILGKPIEFVSVGPERNQTFRTLR